MRLLVVPLVAVLLALGAAPAAGQTAKDAAVLIVFDASKSMRDDDGSGRPKIEAAKEGLNKLVAELPEDAKVGLRVYGSEASGTGKEEGCRDTRLVAPVRPLDRALLMQQIDALQPRGFTPIGNSLRAAARDLGGAKQKTIVLVSDGGDNCAPPSPCSVAREISKQGVALKIQAVGFQVKPSARRQLQCIADAGGGRYVDAQDADELGSQLRSLAARALRPYVTQGRRLEAAATPPQAKLYGAGQYTTEIAAAQPAWYSFRVGAGQSIAVSATLPDSPAGIPSLFRLELQDESLEFEDSGAATNSADVLTAIAEAEVGEDELRSPPIGRYFVRLEVDPREGQSGPYPVELAVRITGTVLPAREQPSAPGPVGSREEGTSDVVLAAGGGGALLVGLLAGAALGGRRRPA